MGEDNRDVKEDSKERTLVLWEKQFQQTIFVDISDNDDSLHFSHLQSFITTHVSHSLAASSENPGLSGSSKFVEDSAKSSFYISSNNRHYSNKSKVKRNEMKVSVSQPHTLPEQMKWTHEDNTSDEDQEELPYDGGKQYHCSNSLRQCNHSPDAFTRSGDKLVGGGIINTICRKPVFAEKIHQASIPDFLGRHFSCDELFSCGRLIEAETMPEVSLMDSINETKRTSPKPHSTTGKHSKFKTSVFELNRDENLTTLEVTDSKAKSAGTETHDSNKDNEVLNQSDFSEKSKSYSSNTHSSPGALLVATEDEKEVVENNLQQSCSVNPPKLHEIDTQTLKCSLGRTSSCNELKYGQGQVHYPLPDFSKVASKIKFPKNDGVSKPGYVPATNRAQTTGIESSILSSPCKADVISRVLEDSDWLHEKPKMVKDEILQSIFDQELQKQYFSETIMSKFSSKKGEGIQDRKDDTKAEPNTFPSTKEGFDEKKRDKIWSGLSKQKCQTEGYRLTVELKDIINHFKVQVKEFEICINNMSMTLEEQKMVFKSMMKAQDQLERNYMRKKEEHRTLELQNYIGFKRNIGEFDPDRLVEGEIFRLGLHLEDIKEQIDRNAYRALSPSPSTTPASPLHEAYISSSSLQPPLQKESISRCSSKSNIRDKAEERYKESYGPVDSPLGCPRENNLRCLDTEAWIASDAEHRLEKGADCAASVDNEVPDVFPLTHRSRHHTNRMSHDSNNSFPVSLQNLAPDTFKSRQGDHYRRASIAPTITITSNTLGNITSSGVVNKSRKNRNITYMKPSYSLPFSFKIQDQQSEPDVTSMKCSIQADSALRPNNIYFYRTESVVHRVKDEALSPTIDKDRDAASLMKQITDHMAKTLSSDLTKAQLYRKLHLRKQEIT